MAKYVGKIFRVNNKTLRIKGSGSHFVHVKWYNPFTHKFRCYVITSLEEKKVLSPGERNNLHIMAYHKENEDRRIYRQVIAYHQPGYNQEIRALLWR